MHLDAYTRALTQARDAVCQTYRDGTGTVMPDDLALAVGMAAIKAFLDAAKGSGVSLAVLTPEPQPTVILHENGVSWSPVAPSHTHAGG